MASLTAHQILRTTLAKLIYDLPHAPTHQFQFTPRPRGTLRRPFTTTGILSKKGGKKSSRKDREDEDIEEEAPSKRGKGGKSTNKGLEEEVWDSSRKTRGSNNGERAAERDETEPFGFSELSKALDAVVAGLKLEISRLPSGGRFNMAALEDLPVQYDKQNNLSAKLKSIAEVLPGKRTAAVIMYDKEHNKAIRSAIQGAASLNLGAPTQNARNELQLDMAIPSPTKESREEAARMVVRAGQKASLKVQGARAAMQKRLRAMKLERTAGPDDLARAQKEMEEVVKKGLAEITKIVDDGKAG